MRSGTMWEICLIALLEVSASASLAAEKRGEYKTQEKGNTSTSASDNTFRQAGAKLLAHNGTKTVANMNYRPRDRLISNAENNTQEVPQKLLAHQKIQGSYGVAPVRQAQHRLRPCGSSRSPLRIVQPSQPRAPHNQYHKKQDTQNEQDP